MDISYKKNHAVQGSASASSARLPHSLSKEAKGMFFYQTSAVRGNGRKSFCLSVSAQPFHLGLVSEVGAEECAVRMADRKGMCTIVCCPVPMFQCSRSSFYRTNASTASITSRRSTRSSVQSEPICSPLSPEGGFQRSSPAKAPASKNGCVKMAFTMEEFPLHRMQPRCKLFLVFLREQGFVWL